MIFGAPSSIYLVPASAGDDEGRTRTPDTGAQVGDSDEQGLSPHALSDASAERLSPGSPYGHPFAYDRTRQAHLRISALRDVLSQTSVARELSGS
jgi:hypothetical protein